MDIKQCRNILRKEILSFSKNKNLKHKFKIEKNVIYNDNEQKNEEGYDTKQKSGVCQLGITIEPYSDGYVMVNWTVVEGRVTWNSEIRFDRKMTPEYSFINLFNGSRLTYNSYYTCSEYLGPLLKELGDNFMSIENGWKFID